jgi:hypothetical protein
MAWNYEAEKNGEVTGIDWGSIPRVPVHRGITGDRGSGWPKDLFANVPRNFVQDWLRFGARR